MITDDGKKMLLRSLLALQDTNGQPACNIALLITDDTDPASIETCKMVLRRSKGLSGELTKTFNPLYIAAMDRESATLTELVLTTCPSIKPSLKLVWLAYRRLGLFLPKVVLRQCIAPFVIYNATNTQLATLQQLANQNTLSDISGRVKGTTLKNLLDPLKIEQHRVTITAELYATITPKPANN